MPPGNSERLSRRLFVYGSLKRDGLHHAELAGAPFLSEARTLPGYTLAPLGSLRAPDADSELRAPDADSELREPNADSGYLALVEAPDAGSVTGELFDVPEEMLARLDAFEGEDYARARLTVVAQNGEKVEALAYFGRTR